MLQPGDALGPYRLVRFLRAGGMGSVYEATHMAMGTRHAIKVLADHYVQTESVRNRFRREARLMFDLGEHPHIVRATDLIDDGTLMALVVDFIDGGDLADVLDARAVPLSWPEAWAVLEPVLSAVAFAHARGVVHRDIKPENVMLRRNGNAMGLPMVTDFGIARILGDDSHTRTDTRMGTPCYGAPEQFVDAKTAGPAADVWALGMLAWRMVSGYLPVDPDNRMALYELYAAKRTVPRAAAVPPFVADAIALCLQVDPRHRPRDASELMQLFQGDADTLADVRRRAGRPRWLTAAAVAVAVAAAAALSWWAVAPAPAAPAVAGPRAVVQDGQTRRGPPSPAAAQGAAAAGAMEAALDEAHAASPSVAAVVALLSAPPPAAVPAPPAEEGMVLLPAATFHMGSAVGEVAEHDEQLHEVILTRPFWIDRTEVTAAAYAQCVAAGRCVATATVYDPALGATGGDAMCTSGRPELQQHPINCVDWKQAAAYCAYVGKRLPTEAEWEFAARGDGRRFVWGQAALPPRGAGNFADKRAKKAGVVSHALEVIEGYDDGYAATAPVASYAADWRGLHDMAGNVWEWVADVYAPYGWQVAVDPPHDASLAAPSHSQMPKRVMRGGAFTRGLRSLRAAYRAASLPEARSFTVGFRCAKSHLHAPRTP